VKKALLISCFDWYEKRLKPIKELLEADEYQVTILTSDFDHIKKIYIDKQSGDCTYIHVPSYKKNISPQRIMSHFVFGKKVSRYLEKLKPDLIYLLLPPNNTADYCLNYKLKNPDCRYILDIIDLWPESMPLGKLKNIFLCKIWAEYRNKSLKKADFIFTECEMYQQVLKAYIRDAAVAETLYLFKEQTESERRSVEKIIASCCGTEKTAHAGRIILGYVGSINNIIDIDGIAAVTAAISDAGFAVEFRVIGEGENKDSFIEALKIKGADVKYYGAVYEEDRKIEILTACDFGINMMKSGVTVGLSIKSIDYFSYGLPIINNIKGDTWKLVESMNIGINYDGYPEHIVENINEQSSNIEKLNTRKNVLQLYDRCFSKQMFVNKIQKGLEIYDGQGCRKSV
jgi:hypothetical protein